MLLCTMSTCQTTAGCVCPRVSRGVSMEWQPIETAPKDGEPFLAAIDHGDGEWTVLRMEWVDWAGCFGDATYHPFIDEQVQPTYWQPLPAPPVQGTIAGKPFTMKLGGG